MANKLTHVPEFKPQAPTLVYVSDQIKRVMEQATRAAEDHGCLVITILGESGVMKTVLSRWIAYKANRKGKVIEIESGSLPVTLIESELYGRKRWAHTDARETRIGLVEGAHGGVCIFNDINQIPVTHQHKLCHFIEHGIYRRVGSDTPRRIDAKRIITSNVNWKTAVRDGLLTMDLYNRLNKFRIHVPALRDRKEDIAVLAKYFLAQKTKDIGRTDICLSSEVERLFMQYDWPRNVRELKDTVESSITRCNGNKILRKHLPEEFGESWTAEDQGNRMEQELETTLAHLGKLILATGFSNLKSVSISSTGLDDEEKELISYMINLDEPVIYRRHYQRETGLSKSSVNRLFKKLEQRGFLKLRGLGRGAFYTISLQAVLRAIKTNELTL